MCLLVVFNYFQHGHQSQTCLRPPSPSQCCTTLMTHHVTVTLYLHIMRTCRTSAVPTCHKDTSNYIYRVPANYYPFSKPSHYVDTPSYNNEWSSPVSMMSLVKLWLRISNFYSFYHQMHVQAFK